MEWNLPNLTTEHPAFEARKATVFHPFGPLSLAGLFWLPIHGGTLGARGSFPVESLGSAEGQILPGTGGQGHWSFQPGAGRWEYGPGPALGSPLVRDISLVPDIPGPPVYWGCGESVFQVIVRGGKEAIRYRKKYHAAGDRTQPVLRFFPYQENWVIHGEYEEFSEPLIRRVKSVIGTEEVTRFDGRVVFGWHGTTVGLLVEKNSDSLFCVFKDALGGMETYGACRFLGIDRPDSHGQVTLDFNFSYNPPCAFSPWATCPTPVKENSLPFPVPAGEAMPLFP